MIYLGVETPTGNYTKLIGPRARVAPLQGSSTPKFELTSAQALVKLIETGKMLVDHANRFWLDSKAAFFWSLESRRVEDVCPTSSKRNPEGISQEIMAACAT